MTCIVGLVYEGNVYIGGDRLGSNGFIKHVGSQPKVFRNGDFIFGYTTSFRMGQLLQHHWSQPIRSMGKTDESYIYVDVVESIRELYKDKQYDLKGNEGGNILFGYNGKLYELQSDYAIIEHLDNCAAVGSGEYHAVAVAKTLMDVNVMLSMESVEGLYYNAELIIQTAIETASYYVTSVGGGIDIVKL